MASLQLLQRANNSYCRAGGSFEASSSSTCQLNPKRHTWFGTLQLKLSLSLQRNGDSPVLLDLPHSFSVSCELAGSPSPHPAFAGSSAEVTGLQSNSPYDVQVVRRGSSADPLFRGVKGGLDVRNGRETGSRQRARARPMVGVDWNQISSC